MGIDNDVPGIQLSAVVPVRDLIALALLLVERLIAFERQSVKEGLVGNARSLTA